MYPQVNTSHTCSYNQYSLYFVIVSAVTTSQPSKTERPSKPCNGFSSTGGPLTDWRCCSGEQPCDRGEGDCDEDSHCAGNFVCGSNNCKRFGEHWRNNVDCCEGI